MSRAGRASLIRRRSRVRSFRTRSSAGLRPASGACPRFAVGRAAAAPDRTSCPTASASPEVLGTAAGMEAEVLGHGHGWLTLSRRQRAPRRPARDFLPGHCHRRTYDHSRARTIRALPTACICRLIPPLTIAMSLSIRSSANPSIDRCTCPSSRSRAPAEAGERRAQARGRLRRRASTQPAASP